MRAARARVKTEKRILRLECVWVCRVFGEVREIGLESKEQEREVEGREVFMYSAKASK